MIQQLCNKCKSIFVSNDNYQRWMLFVKSYENKIFVLIFHVTSNIILWQELKRIWKNKHQKCINKIKYSSILNLVKIISISICYFVRFKIFSIPDQGVNYFNLYFQWQLKNNITILRPKLLKLYFYLSWRKYQGIVNIERIISKTFTSKWRPHKMQFKI